MYLKKNKLNWILYLIGIVIASTQLGCGKRTPLKDHKKQINNHVVEESKFKLTTNELCSFCPSYGSGWTGNETDRCELISDRKLMCRYLDTGGNCPSDEDIGNGFEFDGKKTINNVSECKYYSTQGTVEEVNDRLTKGHFLCPPVPDNTWVSVHIRDTRKHLTCEYWGSNTTCPSDDDMPNGLEFDAKGSPATGYRFCKYSYWGTGTIDNLVVNNYPIEQSLAIGTKYDLQSDTLLQSPNSGLGLTNHGAGHIFRVSKSIDLKNILSVVGKNNSQFKVQSPNEYFDKISFEFNQVGRSMDVVLSNTASSLQQIIIANNIRNAQIDENASGIVHLNSHGRLLQRMYGNNNKDHIIYESIINGNHGGNPWEEGTSLLGIDTQNIENRVEAFKDKVCQGDGNCPIGKSLIQLIDFETLTDELKTNISVILNPLAHPQSTYGYQCIENTDLDVWKGFLEKDYSTRTSCHKADTVYYSPDATVRPPSNISLFDKGKYDFEVYTSIYGQHEDLINIQYIRIENPQYDRFMVLKDNIGEPDDTVTPNFPGDPLTGNYFIIHTEAFNQQELNNFQTIDREQREKLLPVKIFYAVKEAAIGSWVQAVETFLGNQSLPKPNPVNWCSENPNNCLIVNETLISSWNKPRYRVPPEDVSPILLPTNVGIQVIKLGKTILDVLDKKGTPNKLDMLLVNDCTYKARPASTLTFNPARSFFDPNDTGGHFFDHQQQRVDTGYSELTSFLDGSPNLAERKQVSEIYGTISCQFNTSYFEYISDFHTVIDNDERTREEWSQWVHAGEMLLAFAAIELLPELELPAFFSELMNTANSLMTVQFIGQVFKEYDKLQECKQDPDNDCALERNQLWVDAAMILLPIVGKVGWDKFKSRLFENNPEFFGDEKADYLNNCPTKEPVVLLLTDFVPPDTSCYNWYTGHEDRLSQQLPPDKIWVNNTLRGATPIKTDLVVYRGMHLDKQAYDAIMERGMRPPVAQYLRPDYVTTSIVAP